MGSPLSAKLAPGRTDTGRHSGGPNSCQARRTTGWPERAGSGWALLPLRVISPWQTTDWAPSPWAAKVQNWAQTGKADRRAALSLP